MSRSVTLLAVVVWFMLMTIRPAHAYLDPSNGSMLLQAVLGGLAGLTALLKVVWESIRSRVRRASTEP